MLSGIVPIAAAIRKRARSGKLEQFEERIVARLGLLAHIVIRSGSDGHPNESVVSEGVARQAIERLARSAGFSEHLSDIVDYGIMLVLIAIHICRQTNLKGDDVLVHARHLLNDAINATATITPPPSFNDAQNPESPAVLMNGSDPSWSLISKAIEKLRAEVLASIPADGVTEHNVLSVVWQNDNEADFSALSLEKYLLTNIDNTAEPGETDLIENNAKRTLMITNQEFEQQSIEDGTDNGNVAGEGRYLALQAPTDQDAENESALMIAPYEPAEAAAEHESMLRSSSEQELLMSRGPSPQASLPQATAWENRDADHADNQQPIGANENDDDDSRYLHEILAVLVQLQDGQNNMTKEIRLLKETVDGASGAFSHANRSDESSPGSRRHIPKPAAPAADDWRRLRKARISEINFDPPPPPRSAQTQAKHAAQSSSIEPMQQLTDSANSPKLDQHDEVGVRQQRAGDASDKKPLIKYKEIEIETPEDAWSDADRNQPSYRPSIMVSPAESTKNRAASQASDEVTAPADAGSSLAMKRNTLNEELPSKVAVSKGDSVSRKASRTSSGDRFRLPEESASAILKSAREVIVNAMSDEPLQTDRRLVRQSSESESDHIQASTTRRHSCRAYCSCGHQTRLPSRAWAAASESETSAGRVRVRPAAEESDDDDAGTRRRSSPRRQSFRRHETRTERRHETGTEKGHRTPQSRMRKSTKRFDEASHSHDMLTSRYLEPMREPRSAYWEESPRLKSYDVGSHRPTRFYGFPECCLNLQPAPKYDLYSGQTTNPYLWRHSDCRYCQIERLGLRMKACSFCP